MLRIEFLFLSLSFFLIAFGQPSSVPFFGACASIFGYGLFFHSICTISSSKKRFWMGTLWFACIQAVQFYWVLYHPFFYIYPLLLLVALLFGVQCGALCLLITKERVKNTLFCLAFAGAWTLLEGARHFIFSGLPFNPAGLLLTGFIWPLQLASFLGVYGLSFFVIFTNLLFTRVLFFSKSIVPFFVLAFFPYIFGFFHLNQHQLLLEQSKKLSVLLLQPAKEIEEGLVFQSAEGAREHVLEDWSVLFSLLERNSHRNIDLIVFPEYVVSYGTFYSVFPFERVQELLFQHFGEKSALFLSKTGPYVEWYEGNAWVSNAFIAQFVADFFNAHVVIGLEDRKNTQRSSEREVYSAAFHFSPFQEKIVRYEKRILVPMGEYIPFSWCQKLAARYGICGSFTPGQEAKVFEGPVPLSPLICYEEIFGDLVREGRSKGAELLVNLTNDGWFPGSNLPEVHFYHARLRTVENGVPLIRACNTGWTIAVDSLGEIIGDLKTQPLRPGALFIELPLYHYPTLYSRFGDRPIFLFSGLLLSVFFILHTLVLLKKRRVD